VDKREFGRTADTNHRTGDVFGLAQFAIASNDQLNVRMTALPKVVFSRTLQEPPKWKNTRFVRTWVEEEITTVKHERREPFRSIGSISLVRA